MQHASCIVQGVKSYYPLHCLSIDSQSRRQTANDNHAADVVINPSMLTSTTFFCPSVVS